MKTAIVIACVAAPSALALALKPTASPDRSAKIGAALLTIKCLVLTTLAVAVID